MVNASDLPIGGRLAGREHRLAVRVYFEDTDLSGVVYHANYLRYMERARSDLLRLAGVDQRAAWDAGEGAYAIREATLRFLAPARLDDALLVCSRVIAIRAPSVVIQQRVRRGADMLVDAQVEAVFVGAHGRARRQPAAWIKAFGPLLWQGEDKED